MLRIKTAMKSQTILPLCFWMSVISNTIAVDLTAIREGIAARAELQVGCAYWSYAALSGSGPNTNKNNYFVYDIGVRADAKMPERSPGVPVGAGDGGWGNSSTLNYWKRVNLTQRGDIVAARNLTDNTYHVGIYIGSNTTISTNSRDIAKSNWPFGTGSDKGEDVRYWNYCGEVNCT